MDENKQIKISYRIPAEFDSRENHKIYLTTLGSDNIRLSEVIRSILPVTCHFMLEGFTLVSPENIRLETLASGVQLFEDHIHAPLISQERTLIESLSEKTYSLKAKENREEVEFRISFFYSSRFGSHIRFRYKKGDNGIFSLI